MANNIDWDKLEQNQTDDIDWDNLDQSVITNKDDRFGYGTAIKTGILGALGNAIGTLDRTVVAEAKPSYMSDAEWESKQGPVHRYIQDFAKDLESSNRVQFDPWSGKNIAQGVAGIVPYAAALAPAAALAMRGGNADALRSAGIGLASKAGLGAKGTQLAGEAFPALGIGTLGAIPEARMEGQSAYEEAIQEGKTEAQANTIKNAVTAYNMALLSGTNAIELATAFGKISSFLPQGTKTRLAAKLAGIGASEGIQEGVQEAIPNIASDKPIDWDAVAQSTVIGGLGGVLLGGAGMGANYAFDKFGNKATTAGDVIQSATQAPTLQTGDNGKESFINAIAGQESGGNYDAQNADSGAFGKYQIMPENWPAWAQEAGLGADAAQTPENQEKVARFKLGQYYDKYGPRGAALAWYGGEGALNYSDEALNRKQGENGEYPSLNEYANSVLERMGVATYSNNDIDAARQFLQDREGTFDDPLTNNLIHDILQSGNDNDILNTAEQIGWKTKKADDITKTEKQPEAEAEENVVSEFTDLDLSTPQQTVTQTNIPRKFKQSSNLSGYKKFFNEEATRKNQYIKDLVQKQRDIITSGKQKSIDYDWYLAEQAKNTGRMVSGADREKVINKALNNSKITMLAKNAMSGNKSAQQAFSKMSPDVKQALLNREADRLQIENEDIAKQQYPDIAKTPFMPAGYYYDKELYKRFLQKKEQEAQPKQSSENEIAALVSAARENAKILNNKNIRLLSEKAKTGNASAQQAFNKISPKVRDFLEYIEANRTKEEMRQGAQEYIQSAYAGNEVKGLKAELKAANEGLEQLLSTALQDLQSGMGQGVTLVPNEDPDKPDRYIRVSNNAQWYSDFYKANKRKPNKRELLDLAIDLYTGKDSHGLSNWYDNGTEEARKYFKENAKNVAYYENLIETYENMLNEYSQKAQTTQQVEPQDEKKEQPKEKVEEVKKPAEKAKETKTNFSIYFSLAGIEKGSIITNELDRVDDKALIEKLNNAGWEETGDVNPYTVRYKGAATKENFELAKSLTDQPININGFDNNVGNDWDKIVALAEKQSEKAIREKEQSDTIGRVVKEVNKIPDLKISAQNNKKNDFRISYFTAVQDYLVENYDNKALSQDYITELLNNDKELENVFAAYANEYYDKNAKPKTKNAAQEQPPAATEEVKATFSDSKTAEDNLAKLLGLTKKKQEPKKEFNVIDDSDAALEEALKELKSEVNKLSANPVFNPDLHKAAFKVGMIYLQRGTNKFADWSKQMIAAVGEKIRPWLGSIWKSIEVYPKNEKLNPEIMSTAVDFVGAKYNEGLRSADEIYQYMVDNYGEEQAKPFKGLIESAFAGIDELYNPTINVEEAAQETPQDQVEETKPAVEKPIEKPIEDVKAKFNINEAQNGIEIKFAEKPSEEFLDKLKAVGYRWSRFKKHWYAKQTPKAMSFAESIGFIPEEKGGITDETTPDNTRTEAGEVGNIETAGTDAGNVPEGRDISVAGGSRSEELDNEMEGTAAENDTTVSENGSVEGESNAAAAVEGSTADISSGRVQDVLNGREGGSESRADVVDRNSSTVSGNYHIDNPAVLLGGSAKTRFVKNKQAIEIINNIISENRHATPEEKDILAAYSGWGSFGQELFQGTWENPKPKTGWEEENQWLRDNLGEEAWKSAQNSILNAHYTDPVTVQTMWAMLEKMGFKGGKILEPSMGVGNFFGLMPKKIMEQSQLTGIELDTITGRMAKELYPKANIQIKGYQDSKTADNFYDVIIGNVPFANYSPNDRRYNKFNATLHDYFFLKGLDQLRPGGIMIAITSKGTMDKADRKVRIALARKADLVTAYRMPTGAFENYAGTQVVTDILVFKKRDKEAEKVAELPWVNTEEHEGGYYNGQEQKYRVNKFFEEHPENVLGEMKFSLTGNMGRPGIQVKRKDDFAQRIEMLPSEVPLNIYEEAKYDQNIQYISNYTKEQQGSVVANDKDNKLYIVEGDYLRPIESVKKYALKDAKKTEARENELKQLIKLRKAYGQLIDAERSGNEDVEKYRKNLNVVYDQYVKDYGKLSSSWGMKYFKSIQEPAFDYLSALENDNGNKATIFKQSTIRTNKRLEKPSVKQAFIIDRNEHKNIDVNRIAELSKTPVEKVIKELVDSGAVFKTPNGNYDLADVYLSGNVRVKLKEAQEALAAGDKDMEHNIEELKKVIPPTIPYFNIETNLGAAWISKQDYIDFIAHLLNVKDVSKIKIIERNGGWTIKFFDSSLNSKPEAVTKYGTGDISFSSLLTHAFNHTKPIIRGPEVDGVKPIDNEKTEKANSKIEAIYDEFQQWLWSSNERKLRLEKEYNEAMNSVAIPQYDGSFMEMPGMALQRGDTQFTLRQHQLNAIYRGIINGSGIYAHEVGTGKTYTMGGIALESRRYGIAKKPLILAHNANSASVAKEIQEMYPGAKILYIDNLDPKSIKRKLNQIMVDDWDVVVMPHSQISKLSLTEETLKDLAEEKITALEDAAIELADEEGENLTVEDMDAILNGENKYIKNATAKKLIGQRNTILQNIQKQATKATSENSIPFENLGIDMIIVDEAHEFKKPPFETKRKMKGLNPEVSSKSINLNFLTDYIQHKNNGKGVHIFTGTPITNTLVELYHAMKYVMPNEMKAANVYNFDSWFNVFAAEVSDIEITSTGEYQPVSRLAAFTNVSELRRMAGQYLDIVFADDMPEFKPRETKSGKTLNDPNLTEEEKVELLDGRTENPVGRPYKRIINEVIPLNTPTKKILNKLIEDAKEFKDATPQQRKDLRKTPKNPAVINTRASNAGVDVRLYDLSLKVPENEDSKEKRLIKNVINIYNEHPKTVQVIFVDRGLSDTKKVTNPHESGEKKTYRTEIAFNMAKDIIDQLVANGIKQDEIILMKSTYSPEKRKEIADKLKKAEYRVVIGSTATLGVGVNMQDNLRAMHHLDAPWMPGLLDQRNGRGHRQGNKWNTVLEIRYITERIDGKRWQTLTIKDKFIKSFMKAKEGIRTIEGDAVDLSEDEGSNDFTETFSKAAADPRILLKAKYEADITKLEKKERVFVKGIEEAKEKIVSLKQANQAAEKSLKELQADEATYKKAKEKPFEIELAGSLDYERKKPIKFVERKAASEHLQKIQKQIVGLDNAMKLGTFAGFDLYISKAKNLTGTESYPISIRGEGVYEAVNSLASIESKLNNLTKQVQNKKSLLEQNKESIKSLEEATKGTFPQAETLAKKRQLLDDITKDLEESPVPPPDWLVQGAPLDSDVYIDNVLHTVNGHKATPEGFYLSVVNEKTDQTSVIPFQNAKDAQGMDIYDTTEHTPSPAYKKKSNQPAEENKQFSLAKPAAKTLTPAEANKWRNKIADTFKNMPLEQNGNNFKVTLPNGRNITIDVVDKVLATDEQLERAKQEHGFTAEETVLVEGYNDILDGNAIMQLLDTTDTGVLDHEILHAAKRMGLTDKENAFLDSKMSEEEQAEDYRAWRSKRIKSSFAGKLWQKIVDFANQVRALMGFENKDNIYRQIETGKVWDRQSKIKPAVSDIKFSIQKANENLAKNIEIREKRYGEGFNLTESVLRSPSWIAEKFPKFKLFFEYANEAMQKQEYLRSWYDRTLKRIDKRLKDKENKKDYQELLWAGDSEGREFTRAELKQQGYNDDVIAAYLTTRQAMAKTYNLLNDARKQVRTYQKNVTAEGLQELKDNQFAEILSVQNNGSDYLVAYKMPKTWERSMAVSAAVLEDLKNDKNIQVLKEEKIADDKFAVKYRQSAADIVKRGGYIPHFFHEWFIMDKSTDQDGKESYTVLGSGRTQSEAVKQAEELLKTNPKANIVISPKQFSLDSEENARAAVIGDSEYQEVVSRIAKDMEMTIAETKDFLQGKLKVKGRHRFFGNFMQRKGAEGFEQDLDWVLRHYFNSSARYVALEDFKPRAIGLFERYFGRFDNDYSGKPLANYVKHYINDINGNPSALETIINNMLNNSEWYKKHVVSHFGERAALQIAGTMTGAISMLKLGFLNFSSAFLNMTQLINTVGLLGSVGDVTTGFAKAMKPSISDQKIFSETGIYNDIGMDTTSGYNRFNPIKCGQLGMYFFRKSDVLARKATVLAAYKNARGKGMTHKEAIEYAKDVNRKANFDYSVADAPNVFRRGSIIAQLALQFKKYPIKELELMYEIATKGTIKQNAKFWGMYFLIAGMLQFPAAEMFDELWKELFGQSPKNEIKRAIFEAAGNDPLLKEMANVAVYGVGALANADLSRRNGLGDVNPANLPSSIGEILFGPTYSTIKQSIAGIPAMLDGNPLPVIKALSPGAANYIQAAQGYSENRRGRKLTDYETTYDQILKAAGFRSVDESKAYDVENIIKEERSNRTKERAAIIDKTIEKLNNGETLSKEDIQELQRLRVTGKQLKEERAKKANSSTGRMKENLSKEERYKYQSLVNTL